MYKPAATDFIVPMALFTLSVFGFVITIVQEGWIGAIWVGLGVGTLAGTGMWMISLYTTWKRDRVNNHQPFRQPKTHMTGILLIVIAGTSIINGLSEFLFNTDWRAFLGSFVSIFVIGISSSWLWDLWHDYYQIK